MRHFIYMAVGLALLTQARCSSNPAPGPVLLSVQRLDAQATTPGASLVTVIPEIAADAGAVGRLGYQAGVPLGEDTTLLLTLGLDAAAAPLDQLQLVAGAPPDGVSVSVIDADTSANDTALAGGTGTAHLSIQAPAAPAAQSALRRWIKVHATGAPRVIRLPFTFHSAPSGKPPEDTAFEVVLGALSFDAGPIVTLPSGSKLAVNRGAASAAPAPAASLDAWPAALADALTADVVQLAGQLSFQFTSAAGASNDDATISAVLDDALPLLAPRIGEAEGLRIGRALGTAPAPDPLYAMSLLASAAAEGQRVAVALVTRDRLAVSGGAIAWTPPAPLPISTAPAALDGLALPHADLPPLSVLDASGAPVVADATGRYSVTPPFTVSYAGPAANRFPSLVLGGSGTMRTCLMTPAAGGWSARVRSAPSDLYQVSVAEHGPDGSAIGSPVRILVTSAQPEPAAPENLGDLLGGDDYQTLAAAPAFAKSDTSVDFTGEQVTVSYGELFLRRNPGMDGSPTAIVERAEWDAQANQTRVTIAVSAGTSGGAFDLVLFNVLGGLQYKTPDGGGDPVIDHAATRFVDVLRQPIALAPGGSTELTFALTGQLGAGASSTLRLLMVPSGTLSTSSDPPPAGTSVSPDAIDQTFASGKLLVDVISGAIKAGETLKAAYDFVREDGVVLKIAFFDKADQGGSAEGTTFAKLIELWVGDIFHFDFSLTFVEGKQRVWRLFQEFVTWGMVGVDGSSDQSWQVFKLEALFTLDEKTIISKTAYSNEMTGFMKWETTEISGQWDTMFDYICASATAESHHFDLKWKLTLQTATHSENGWHNLFSAYPTKDVYFPLEVNSVLKDDLTSFDNTSVNHGEHNPFNMNLGIVAPPGTRKYRIISASSVTLLWLEPTFDSHLTSYLDENSVGGPPINGTLPEPPIGLGMNNFRQYRWIVDHAGDSHPKDAPKLTATYTSCDIPVDGQKITSDDACATRCGKGTNGTPAHAWRAELPSPATIRQYTCKGSSPPMDMAPSPCTPKGSSSEPGHPEDTCPVFDMSMPSPPDMTRECTGSSNCGGNCVDTTMDPTNCGQCGNACASGQNCTNGQCTNICNTGLTYCSGQCVDTKTDPQNCGGCGQGCSGGWKACCAGKCIDRSQDTTCGASCGSLSNCSPSGEHCCTANSGFPVCVDFRNSATCGSCNNNCGDLTKYPRQHTNWQCCNNGTSLSCADIEMDPMNCNGCNLPCAAGMMCSWNTAVGEAFCQ